MKNTIQSICICFLAFVFYQCSAQTNTAAIINTENTGDEFTFHAERANPMNYDVINVVNSIPNAPQLRTFQISGNNYGIDVTKEKIDVVLPYFGRSFTSSYGNTDVSYRFVSNDFALQKIQGKKGKWIYKIKPNDVNNVSEIIIEVYKNGKALTSIRSSDRQPISYDGYISKNEVKKE